MHKYETTNLLELVNSRLELLGVRDEKILLGLRAITGEYLKRAIGGYEFLEDELNIQTEYAEDSIKYVFDLIYTDCKNSIELIKKENSIEIGMFLDHEYYIIELKDNLIETHETKGLTYTHSESIINDGEIENTYVKRYDGADNTNQEAQVTPVGVKLHNNEFYSYNKERIMAIKIARYESYPNILYLSDLIEETKCEMDKDLVKENIKQKRLHR